MPLLLCDFSRKLLIRTGESKRTSDVCVGRPAPQWKISIIKQATDDATSAEDRSPSPDETTIRRSTRYHSSVSGVVSTLNKRVAQIEWETMPRAEWNRRPPPIQLRIDALFTFFRRSSAFSRRPHAAHGTFTAIPARRCRRSIAAEILSASICVCRLLALFVQHSWAIILRFSCVRVSCKFLSVSVECCFLVYYTFIQPHPFIRCARRCDWAPWNEESGILGRLNFFMGGHIRENV